MLHLRIAPFEKCSIWELLHLRNAPFEKCSIWELLHLRNAPFEKCSIWEVLHLRNAQFSIKEGAVYHEIINGPSEQGLELYHLYISQMEHFSNGAILKSNISQMEHFSNEAILKWSNSQIKHFSNGAIWGRHHQLDDSLVGQLTSVLLVVEVERCPIWHCRRGL